MIEQFTVRRTIDSDGEILHSLRIASLKDAPFAFGAKLDDVLSQPAQAFHDAAVRHSISDISTSFIAFSGEQAIGTVGAFFDHRSPNQAFICALWVAPQFRGGNRARTLVTVAVAWLVARCADEVFAWVADNNTRALALYRKVGFMPTAVSQPLPSNEALRETLLCYKKQ
jgi:ribosomal protein S18 acetylase RimI-like enzyme